MDGDEVPERWDEAVVVALGANLPAVWDGRPARSVEAGLEGALDRFSDAGLIIVKRSRWWRSAAWPDAADPPFLNGVALVETALDAPATLEALHALERAAGRVRERPNGPRPLDLDLVAYGRQVSAAPPLLPHPRAADRRFVMGPLAELAPGWRHPLTGATAATLADRASVGRDAEAA